MYACMYIFNPKKFTFSSSNQPVRRIYGYVSLLRYSFSASCLLFGHVPMAYEMTSSLELTSHCSLEEFACIAPLILQYDRLQSELSPLHPRFIVVEVAESSQTSISQTRDISF